MSPTETKIVAVAKSYGIINLTELSMLLAQMNHESGAFTKLVENLSYTPAQLLAQWPSRFSSQTANAYGRTDDQRSNQTMIANIAYSGRMGNGPIASNDGYKYRGGGFIQLTGANNYLAFLNWGNNSAKPKLALNPDTVCTYVRSPEGAILSSVWFWIRNSCGVEARNSDIVGVTRIINGGTIGLTDRIALFEKYKSLLGI